MRFERDSRYDELRRRNERDPKYWVEYLKIVFSEDVGRLMDEKGMSQSDLARELGVSRAYVTRLFRGTFNPTVETLVKVALALDARVSLRLNPCRAAASEQVEQEAIAVADRPASRKRS